MRKLVLSLMALASLTAWAQFGAPRQNPIVPSVKAEVEDFKPATSNQENKQFPAINSKRQFRAQI
jgi:enterochelin esterase family protein